MSQFFALNIYQNDTKAQRLNARPVGRITNVTRHMVLNTVNEYSVDALLTDKLAGNVGRGQYVELAIGYTHPTSWFAGYVTEIAKSDTRQGSYTITLLGAEHILSGSIDLPMEMPYPIYKSVGDALNGVNAPGTPATPGTKGLLGSDWQATWVGKGGWPGIGDSWRTDWATKLTNLNWMANHYGFQWRARADSLAHWGFLECGGLRDHSGLAIYGGDPLLQKLASLGLAMDQGANAWLAQKAGLVQITAASYTETYDQLFNLFWGIGAGSYETLVTIRSIFGDVVSNSAGDPAPGVEKWQPDLHGKVYYVKANAKANWNGHTYELVASQDNFGNWQFGAVDRTSVALHGVIEKDRVDKMSYDPQHLLSILLGALESSANPVGTWEFGCLHPLLDDNMVPQQVRVGQLIDAHYAGKVYDSQDLDPATGIITGLGGYTYMDYPGTTDPQQIGQLQQVVEIHDQWANGVYTATYTLGKGKNKIGQDTHLASQMARQQHAKPKKHTFYKKKIDDVTMLCSQNPDAWVDNKGVMHLRPGAMIVSDVPNETFFDEHHAVEFTVEFSDDKQYCDFLFSKKADGTVTNIHSSQRYALWRLAMPNSGHSTGFYTSTDGTPATTQHHGTEPHKRIFSKGKTLPPNKYRVKISWSGNIFEAHISTQQASGKPHLHALVSTWHEYLEDISTGGAIGWHTVGGTQDLLISQLSAHPQKKKSNASHGGDHNGAHAAVTSGNSGKHTKKHIGPDNKPVTTHVTTAAGATHQVAEHRHGPAHPTTAKIAGISGQTITLQSALQANSLRAGYIVTNATDDFVSVASVQTDGSGQITGFTTNDSIPFGSTDDLSWDPLDVDVPTAGHALYGIYDTWVDKSGKLQKGWCHVVHPADAPNDGSMDLIYRPDGSMATGAYAITQANGAVVNLDSQVVQGESLALGLEQSGDALMFDSGEYDSTSQKVELYVGNGTPDVWTPSTVEGGTQNLYGKAPNVSNASWLSHTPSQDRTIGDAILALTTGVHGAKTYNTVRWYDLSPTHEDGTARNLTVNNDMTFAVPIWIGALQTPSTLAAGAVLTLLAYNTATQDSSGKPTIYVEVDGGTFSYIMAGDTFVIGSETFTVASTDANRLGIHLVAPLTQTHNTGDQIYMTKANGGTIPVTSGLVGNGTIAAGDVGQAVDGIMVGYYGTTSDGTSGWYRAWWGDPAWKPPFASGAIYMGRVPVKNAQWKSIQFKASDVGMWAPSLPALTLTGVELAIYTANASTGQTVYFDAHGHGFANNAPLASGSVDGGAIQSGSIDPTHLDNSVPTAHTFTDANLFLLKDKATGHWRLHWCNGVLETQDGTVTTNFAINAGTAIDENGSTVAAGSDYPNYGIDAVPRDVNTTALLDPTVDANVVGGYVVFNTAPNGVYIADPGAPGGSAYVPGYQPVNSSSSANGQSRGFAVLTEKVSWTQSPGGGNILQGVPSSIYFVGKINKTADSSTGAFVVQTYGLGAKAGGDSLQTGSVGAPQTHPSVPFKFHLMGINLSVASPDFVNHTASIIWTGGTIEDDDGNGAAGTIGQGRIDAVATGRYIAWDSVNRPNSFNTLSPTTDFSKAKNQRWWVVGRLGTDSAGQFQIFGQHVGSIVLNDAALGGMGASKVQGQLGASQIGGVNAPVVQGQLGANQIGGVNASAVQGQLGASQISGVNAPAIIGQIGSSQISGVNAAIINGQLTDAQLQNIAGYKVGSGVPIGNLSGKRNAGEMVNPSSIDGPLIYPSTLRIGNISLDASYQPPVVSYNVTATGVIWVGPATIWVPWKVVSGDWCVIASVATNLDGYGAWKTMAPFPTSLAGQGANVVPGGTQEASIPYINNSATVSAGGENEGTLYWYTIQLLSNGQAQIQFIYAALSGVTTLDISFVIYAAPTN